MRRSRDTAGRTGAARPDGSRTGRVEALDGLKGLAILAVVLYHMRPPVLAGGFVGVTVFFVLGGYLTTRSLERAIGRRQGFTAGRYVFHRLATLAPASLACVGGTIVLTTLFAPWLLAKVHADAVPAVLFVTNWAYIVRKVPYFAAAGLPSPLTHYWYLGVYLQFVALWTPLLVLLSRHVRTRRQALGVVCALTLASAVSMAVLFDTAGGDSTRAYYGLDARLAEPLVGAALALAVRPGRVPAGPLARASVRRRAGLVGAAVLGLACVFARGSSPLLYNGGYLALALATAAVTLAVVTEPSSLGARLLAARPLAALGRRSLAVYLWHYPLLIVMNPATRTRALPWWAQLAELVVIAAVAELTWRVFELGWWPSGLRVPAIVTRGLAGLHRRALAGAHALAERILPPRRSHAGAEADTAPGLRVHAARVGSRAAGVARAHWRSFTWAQRLAIIGTTIALVVGLSPLDWNAIANPQAGGIHDVRAPRTTEAQTPGPSTEGAATNTAAAADAPDGNPFIDKVPDNLDPGRWSYDANARSTNASVLVIGDSVTDDARYSIARRMPAAYVDAKTSRQFYVGAQTYRDSVAAGHDADVIVVALGGNGLIANEAMVQELIDAVGGKPLYFVTIRCPDSWQDPNNALLRQVAAKNGNVGIIDWHAASTGHDDWLVPDGQHLTATGYDAYANLLMSALVKVEG